jgi:hypothetical protein
MTHSKRRWTVGDVETPEELAHKLTQYTWTGCRAFRLVGSGLLFLNDSFSEDGAQEYGVVIESTRRQVESVTFGWMSEARARDLLLLYLTEPPAEDCGQVDPSRWAPDAHPERCFMCV